MTKADLSELNFRKGYNCAQTVLQTFKDDLGITEDQAMLVSSAFGAGIGLTRNVCGAVTGMAMLLGLKLGYTDPDDGDTKMKLYQITKEAINEFEKEFGSIECYELLGLKKGEFLGEPKIRTEQYYQERPCIRVIRKAVTIAEKYL